MPSSGWEYRYDLVSGKVNEVAYQSDQSDGYYYDDAGRSDYRPIGRAIVPAPFSNFEQVGGSVSSPLYNGNIAAMGVQIDYGAGGGGQGTGLREPLLYAYRYDQLHRLVGMQAHRNLVNNQWRPVALDDYREWVSYDANGNIRSYDRNGTTTAYGTPATSHALEMDRLSYGYTEVSLNGRQVLASNRLRHVKDQVSDANRYTEDIDNQADDNYSYDAIGNLVRDQQGGNEEIRWTVYGKIAGIHKTDGTRVYYSYDASGNRISKTVDRSGSTNPSAGVMTTWYVRDAQGNVLSTYEKRGSSPLEQTELHLYGSSRLGIQRTGGLVVEGSLVSLYTYSTETLVRGRKLYELSNHLGNVLATITDKKVLVADGGSVGGTGGVCANGGLVEVLDVYNRDGSLSSYRARQEINFYSAFESGSSDEWEGYIDAGGTSCDNNGGGGTGSGMPAGSYYVADLVSGTDYAPFGMGLVGRTYNSGAYKYGYNGKERDQDIGEDDYDYGMRISDQRLGRFLSVDPLTKEYPWNSTYAFAENSPIENIDLDGLEKFPVTDKAQAQKLPYSLQASNAINVENANKANREAAHVIARNNYIANVRHRYARLNSAQVEKTTAAMAKGIMQGADVGLQVGQVGANLFTLGASRLINNGAFRLTRQETRNGKAEFEAMENNAQKELEPNTNAKQEFEIDEGYVSVFHKGELKDGKVGGGKPFSTGRDKESVDGLDRKGEIWEFKIPKSKFKEWERDGLVNPWKDYDYKTGQYNEELRFEPKVFEELNKMIIKK